MINPQFRPFYKACAVSGWSCTSAFEDERTIELVRIRLDDGLER